MSDRRNPYLILGVDHGAGSDDATAAFARASRRVRTRDDAPYSLEDITWALHELEQPDNDLDSSLGHFRVPANPDAYPGQHRADLLAPQPIPPRTSNPGTGLDELEAHALLSELHHDLQQATRAALEESRPQVAPAQPASPPAVPPPPSAPPTFPVARTPPGPPAPKSSWLGKVVAAIVAILAVAAIVIGAQESNTRDTAAPSSPADDREAAQTDGGTQPANPAEESDHSTQSETSEPPDEAGTPPEPDSQPESDGADAGGSVVGDANRPTSAPETPSPPQPAQSLEPGDCLHHTGGDMWDDGRCGGHDAEVISAHGGAVTSGICPPEHDASFSDDWGVYCALIVTDDTPAGGHWGIGPVDIQTCLDVDPQGHLRGKAPCDDGTIPVLATAPHPDGCMYLGISESFIYWEATDGSGNVLCVDQFHWDAAGLPPPN